MLKVPLNEIDPQKIYEFLQTNVGPLKMLIQHNYAIIKFDSQTHYHEAISKYKLFSICKKQFTLSPFEKNQQNTQSPTVPIKNPQEKIIPELMQIVKKSDQQDKQTAIMKVVKIYRNNMVELVTSYNVFMKAIQSKMTGNRKESQEQQMKNLLDKRLKNITKQLKRNFINLNIQVKHFGLNKSNSIDLDPKLILNQPIPLNLYFSSPYQYISYMNNDHKSQIRRICSLNQEQIICSTQFEPRINHQKIGKLKIFNIKNEAQHSNILINESSYGLITLGNYILAGTSSGQFSFSHKDKINCQQLSPKYFGDYDKDHYIITDLFKVNKRTLGYNIFALGKRRNGEQQSIVKSFYAKEEVFQDDVSSLVFQINDEIYMEKGKIQTMEVVQDGNKVILGCQGFLKIYDVSFRKVQREIKIQGDTLRIKSLSPNLIVFSQKKQLKNYISFHDLRDPRIRNLNYKAKPTALCSMNDNSIMYGTQKGQVGLIDLRRQQKQVWLNISSHCQQKIEDMIKHDNMVISGDKGGQLVGWKDSVNQ